MAAFKIPFGAPGASCRIETLNWPGQFPYKPEVSFTIWHDGHSLHITFAVSELTTKAEQTVLGGDVYKDSCVECFIQPDGQDPRYYNFEFNAAGKLAMACRTGRTDPSPAPLEVLRSVKVCPSLGTEPFTEKQCGPWTLSVEIPASALFAHEVKSFSGRRMKMNLYKCGDGLKTLHYVTWRPIETANPDYHRPEFFQEVEFE